MVRLYRCVVDRDRIEATALMTVYQLNVLV